MIKEEEDFYEIIAELVDYHQRDNSWKRADIAQILGVSDNFVRKIHSRSSNKRYSIKHLFLLSRIWNIDISNLFPSEENLLKIERCNHLNIEERKNILKQMEDFLPLRKEDEYE